MANYLTIVLAVLISSTGFAQKSLDDLLNKHNKRSIPYISVEQVRMMQLNSTVTILDTREIDEYNVSHIEGATYVGYNHFSVEKISDEIENKNTPIIVYCSLGIRSEDVGEKLKKAGFTNVKNVYGGIFEWKNKAFPILNNNNIETDSVHTFSKEWSAWLKNGIKVFNQDNTKK